MALAMRLSRGGRKGRPFYRIVVADKRMPRDGRYIERLGTYNPLLADNDDNRVQLVEDRIKHWLDKGAQPSERVALFLGKAGLIPMPAQPNRPNKSKPGEKAQQLIADKKEKQEAAKEAAKQAEEEAKAAAEAAKAEEEAKAAEAEAEAAPEAPAEEAPAEAAAEEAPAEEKAEEPKAEETPAEEKAEEPAAEEAKAEDTPAEDKADEKAEEKPAE